MKQYAKQPSLKVFLEENPTLRASDYKSRFIGNYKGHHRKLKALFNNPKIKQEKQVTPSMAKKILSPSEKTGWHSTDAWSLTSF